MIYSLTRADLAPCMSAGLTPASLHSEQRVAVAGTGMAQGKRRRGLLPPRSTRAVTGLRAHDTWGPAHPSAAPTRVCRCRCSLCRRALTLTYLVCMCAHNHCPPGRHPAAVCAGIAMCRRVQACSGRAQRRSRSTKMPARVQSCHMRVQAHAHRWRHVCHCQGPAGLGAGAGHSPWGAPRQGRGETSWGSQPSAMPGGNSVPGSGGPTGPGPSCHPPHRGTPSPLLGLHMGLGQTPAKWAGGGLHFKAFGWSKRCCPPAGLSPARAP